MLKAPIPGTVKTRLARDVGPEMAAAIYRTLVEHQVLEIPPGWRRHVVFAPADAGETMRHWLGPDFFYTAQVEGDLGDRLSAAARELARGPDERLVFLGGDCPELTRERLERLAASDAEIAIIPALDGGYCALAMRGNHPGIFKDLAWSTDAVLRETLDRCASLGLSVEMQEPALEDVDDLASWQRTLATGSIKSPTPTDPT